MSRGAAHGLENGDPGDPAAETSGETLEDRIAIVVEQLPGVRRKAEEGTTVLEASGRAFGIVALGSLEVRLDPAVARAALATADTRPSSRGAGWILFTPVVIDRFALDRADAWLRSAHRRAAAAQRGN